MKAAALEVSDGAKELSQGRGIEDSAE